MQKQTLTPDRANKIFSSVQYMAIMAELISMEHQMHMDANFKNPAINNFAGRIGKDAEAVRLHLLSNPKLTFKDTDREFSQEYTAELWRVFHFFIGLPVEQIREFMDGVDNMPEESEK